MPFFDVLDFKGGNQPPKQDFVDRPLPGYVRLLQIRDFASNNKAVFIEASKKWQTCNEPDILVGRYGASVGKVLRGKSGAYNVALVKMIIRDRCMEREFLYYWLKDTAFQNTLLSVSRSAQNGFNKNDLKALIVPVPPVAEQRRIVARIEALFARTRRARADLERIAPLSKRFRKRLLATQLTAENKNWPILTVAEVSDNHDGRRVPIKESDRAKRRGPFPYFGASGQIDTIDDFLFDGKYILVSEDGANLLARSTAIAFQAAGRFWVNNHAHVLTAKRGVIRDFLEYAIEAHDLTSVVTGSAQPKLTQKALNALSVPVPPVDEQAQVISTIQRGHSATRTAELDASRALALLDRLEQSILARAFRGELVSQNPADRVHKAVSVVEPITTVAHRRGRRAVA